MQKKSFIIVTSVNKTKIIVTDDQDNEETRNDEAGAETDEVTML
jgi:hypothetical protein